MSNMNWNQYEQFCVDWWNLKNPADKARLSKRDEYGRDGGVDIVIETSDGYVLGQCKHYWGSKYVGVGVIKELHSDIQLHKKHNIKKGIIFTSGHCSKTAQNYAKVAGIEIIKLIDPDFFLNRPNRITNDEDQLKLKISVIDDESPRKVPIADKNLFKKISLKVTATNITQQLKPSLIVGNLRSRYGI